MSQIEKAVMSMIWADIQTLPRIDIWRSYDRGFSYDSINYRFKCKFKIEGNYLKLIDSRIEHEQETIDLIH